MAIYRFNFETKELDLISDRIGKIPSSVYWPDGCDHSGMNSEHLGKTFRSKNSKRRYLKENRIAEAG